MLVFGLSLRILAYYTIYALFYPDAYNIPLFYFPKLAIATFSIYSIVGLVASFHLIKHSYRTLKERQVLEKTAQDLEKGKLEAELKLLKSQINPHFLFNTLNNLYVLALNSSNRAPEVVYKLSQLMSYMLYESNQTHVALGKEIQYVQNYIALEKIRYGDRLDVALNIFVEDTEGIQIPPLLLLPYIDNFFKHGVCNQIDKVWVRIDILVQDEQLVLKVENSKSYFPEDLTRKKSGIGLYNARKRLDLIYKDCYNLQIFNEDETFLVILKIQLNGEPVKENVLVRDEVEK
jgi:sensor histidine kinase YesM